MLIEIGFPILVIVRQGHMRPEALGYHCRSGQSCASPAVYHIEYQVPDIGKALPALRYLMNLSLGESYGQWHPYYRIMQEYSVIHETFIVELLAVVACNDDHRILIVSLLARAASISLTCFSVSCAMKSYSFLNWATSSLLVGVMPNRFSIVFFSS